MRIITVADRVDWLRRNNYNRPYSAPPDILIDACIRAESKRTPKPRRKRK